MPRCLRLFATKADGVAATAVLMSLRAEPLPSSLVTASERYCGGLGIAEFTGDEGQIRASGVEGRRDRQRLLGIVFIGAAVGGGIEAAWPTGRGVVEGAEEVRSIQTPRRKGANRAASPEVGAAQVGAFETGPAKPGAGQPTTRQVRIFKAAVV